VITGTANFNASLACADSLNIGCTIEFPAFGIVISSFDPKAYPALNMPAGTIGRMMKPRGPSQTIDELSGASSISAFDIQCNDPTNVLKPLVARNNFIGTVAVFKLGFLPIAYTVAAKVGLTYADFNVMHTMQVLTTSWSSDGLIVFHLVDPIRYQVYQIFNSGGPAFWAPGLVTPPQPAGPNVNINGQPISSENPLWLQGNPLDLFLAVLQNFVGLGQKAGLPQSQWTLYQPPNVSTLINPNPYVDVPGVLAMKNQYFSGDWMEFRISDATTAKDWIETQLLKPLGLYTIVRASGAFSLKQMKSVPSLTPVASLDNTQIVGIPQMDREPVLNVLRGRLNVNKAPAEDNRAGKQFQGTWVWWSQASITQYLQQYIHEVESQGLITPRGGFMRLGLLAQRIFARHGFGTPWYSFDCSGSYMGVELADIVGVTHPKMLDYVTGLTGISNVPCEVIERQPDYDKGTMSLKVLDTRFMQETAPASGVRAFAPIGTPTWDASSPTEQAEFFYVSNAAGEYLPGPVPGDPIY
jgi:hypothetical protein